MKSRTRNDRLNGTAPDIATTTEVCGSTSQLRLVGMSNLCRILGASAVALAVTTGSTMPADAQQSVGRAGIPTRVLNLASAVTADSLGTFIVVRALSTGAILVNDVQRYRVLHFDASLKISRVVMDSAVTAP